MRSRVVSAGVIAAVIACAGSAGAEDVAYSYDALGRLKTVTNSDGTVITYAYDPAGNRVQQTITGGPNRPPTAKGDSVTTTKNAPKTILALANDTDPENLTLTITGATQPLNGATTFTATQIVYTPALNYTGPDSFSYTISDPSGATATGMIGVTVTAANQAPVAVADTATTQKNTPTAILPLANDTDPEGQTLSITSVSTTTTHGTASFSGGTVTYTPATDYTGSDTISYTISDGALTATGTITVTVNAPPVANADARSTARNTPDVFDSPKINDTDLEGGTLSVSGVSNATNGTVSRSGDIVTFTPTAGFTGTGGYDYTINDTLGGSATGHVTVTVTVPPNQPPVAVDDAAYYQRGSANRVVNVLTNDTDPDGDTLTVTSATGATHGTLLITSGTVVRYTPTDLYYIGTDSFTYTVSDGNGNTDTGAVTITYNSLPVAVDDARTTAINTADVFNSPKNNDTDADGDTLTVSATSNVTNGTVSRSGSIVTFTPTAGFTGIGGYDYTINDGKGGTGLGHVTVNIGGGNTAPTAVTDTVTAQKNTALAITPLINDTDPEGQTLSITGIGTPPTHGTTSLSGGTVTYTPTTGYTGADSFTYAISDGNGGTATGTVNVTVNDPPVAVADSRTTATNTADVFNSPKTNDTDSDGGAISITGVSGATNGTVSLTGNTATFTPTTGFTGSGGYSYAISDGQGGTATGAVTVTVTGGNQPPVAVDDAAYYQRGSANRVVNVLTNDTDPDGDTLTVTSATGATHGTLLITSGTVVRYTPTDLYYIGTDSFTYTVSDGNGNTDTGAVTITYNSLPVAVDDARTTAINTADVFNSPKNNDTDADGDTLTVSATSNVTNGTVSRSGSIVTFTPTTGFTGSAGYDYTTNDGKGGTDTGHVTITVN